MLKRSFYIDDSFDHMVNYQIQNASYQFRLDLLVSPYSTYKIKNTYDEIVKQFNTFYITKNSYTIINTKEHSNSSWETDLFSSFQFGEFKRFIDNNECEEKKRMNMYFFLIFLWCAAMFFDSAPSSGRIAVFILLLHPTEYAPLAANLFCHGRLAAPAAPDLSIRLWIPESPIAGWEIHPAPSRCLPRCLHPGG